jgi:hypothetical protein
MESAPDAGFCAAMFNINKIYALLTEYLCVVCVDVRKKQLFFLYTINWIFITEKESVYFEERNKALDRIQVNISLERVLDWRMFFHRQLNFYKHRNPFAGIHGYRCVQF